MNGSLLHKPSICLACREGTHEYVTVLAVDDWECPCGNRPHLDGFYAYADGREVEPTPGWGGLYVCAACLRLIDNDTARVVGRAPTVEWLP